MDSLSTYFRQSNPPDLASLDILPVDDAKSDIQRDIRIAAPELEDVDLLAPLELRDAGV